MNSEFDTSVRMQANDYLRAIQRNIDGWKEFENRQTSFPRWLGWFYLDRNPVPSPLPPPLPSYVKRRAKELGLIPNENQKPRI